MRDKLINVLCAFDGLYPRNCGFLTGECKPCEELADHLIAHGVTIAEDNNVGDKCDYCQEFSDPCGVPMIASEDSDPDRGIYLYNGFLCASGGEYCEAKVKFCPMCGRELSESPKEGE